MQPGTQLGPYEILEPIGSGGMGEVYRAHDSNLRRDVAVKLLPSRLSDDPEGLARQQREARALASLNHPRVATVHGLEERDGTRFIVMELVEGETLGERLESGPLQLPEALELACQIARGLEAAHDRGIVHRDLKPANVKVTPEGRVKLLDFGLAKPLVTADDRFAGDETPTASADLTRAGAVLGTAPYMSPEQIRGESLDERTDVWAFGCLLYEMLTGQKAFRGATRSDVLAGALRDDPDPDALPARTPSQVRRLLSRALTRELDRRLRHIADARIELEDALDALEVQGSDRAVFGGVRASAPSGPPGDGVTSPGSEAVSPRPEAGSRGAEAGSAAAESASRNPEAAPAGATKPGPGAARPGPEGVSRGPGPRHPASGSSSRDPGPELSPRSWSTAARALLLLFVLAAAVAVAGWYVLGPGDPAVTDRSIAVLPFETLGEDEATTFTDGVHADVLTRLSKISGLSVTSRTSVMRFRRPDRPLPEIARELGVTWVLLGEVQEAGDQVQVNARLVNAAADRQVWTESYRRRLTAANLFEIQSEVTKRIAEQLEARLSPAERRAIEHTPTADLEAYRSYVRGREQLEQRTEASMRQAVDHFQAAIDRDPDYALAWAGAADALLLLGWYGHELPGSAPDPGQAARRALELGPQLSEAHTSMGIFWAMQGAGPAMLRELERGTELRPSNAEAHIWLAWGRLMVGRPREALEAGQRALELDPLAPPVRTFSAEAYLANGEVAEALRHARRARELQPEYGLAHFMEGLVLYHSGRHTEAASALTRALSLVPVRGSPSHSEVRAVLAVIYAVSGDRDEARDLLARIDDDEPFSLGLVQAALGDVDSAFETFARVREWDSFSMEHLRYFFPEVLAPLREDPRYGELLRQVNRSWGLEE